MRWRSILALLIGSVLVVAGIVCIVVFATMGFDPVWVIAAVACFIGFLIALSIGLD